MIDKIYKRCKIVPLENENGIITAIYITKRGIEYQVRYFLNGEAKHEYFFEHELEFINE